MTGRRIVQIMYSEKRRALLVFKS